MAIALVLQVILFFIFMIRPILDIFLAIQQMSWDLSCFDPLTGFTFRSNVHTIIIIKVIISNSYPPTSLQILAL